MFKGTTVNEIGNRHMNPDEIEMYSLGYFSEEEAAPFDEHLLFCECCRTNVEASDVFAAAMRAAASQIRKKTGRANPEPRSGCKARTAGAFNG